MRTLTEEMLIEICAQAAHDTNNTYCRAIGDTPSPQWSSLTSAQREGVRAGVRRAASGGTARESHELWMASRLAEGWVYGPEKNFSDRTSPNLVPYDDLPPEQRIKNDLFLSVVRAVYWSLRERVIHGILVENKPYSDDAVGATCDPETGICSVPSPPEQRYNVPWLPWHPEGKDDPKT